MRRPLRALVLLAAVVSPAFAAPGATDPLDALRSALDHQDQLIARQQFESLVTEADALAKKDGTPEALYLLGRALGTAALARKQAGDESGFKEKIDRSQRCFEDAKDSGAVVFAPAYLGLARCARYRGDNDTAIQHLRQALKIAPGFRAAALDLAQVCAEKGLGDDAEFILYRQLELYPGDADVTLLLGMVKLARKRSGEAEKLFRDIVKADAKNPQARKLLAATLMNSKQYDEAAEHLEAYRRMNPRDEETYHALFIARVNLKQREAAMQVLEDMRRELAGTAGAAWATRVAEEYRSDPSAFEGPTDEKTPQALAKKLDSNDPKIQAQALADMRGFEWPALPGAVYRLLAPTAGTPEVRRAAVQLIGAQRDPRTVTILEVLLFHPREQDPDPSVRREAARAMSGLPTPAIVPVLVKALDQADVEIREAAVRGIASITGKYFREKLEVVTDAAAWPGERKLFDTWWRGNAGAALAKRDAVAAMSKLFEPIQRGRKRLAEYALPALDDADARTWRAGYDLFRALSGQDFGRPADEKDGAERARLTAECRAWFVAHGNEE